MTDSDKAQVSISTKYGYKYLNWGLSKYKYGISTV